MNKKGSKINSEYKNINYKIFVGKLIIFRLVNSDSYLFPD